ncbi:hypothetical protein GFY24_34350 [Nocardia sp. SYP-A9097]|uniref:hypothetical protein n=1 Tax=Nocardia sp. SYP-A9097 TaxID=2663237 RepID=UPI00129A1659|nr:hypothetical protein [Nocardia sp. SYP-A9097]MRH92446.1 hypothetical protein [Nocardia sp. SYP-A9097]
MVHLRQEFTQAAADVGGVGIAGQGCDGGDRTVEEGSDLPTVEAADLVDFDHRNLLS